VTKNQPRKHAPASLRENLYSFIASEQ